MKEKTDQPNRAVLAPIMLYLMPGYALLYGVYFMEQVAERFSGYCRLFQPIPFTVTAWHEHKMWISFAYPVVWPFLAVRGVALVVLSGMCAALQFLIDVSVVAWQGLVSGTRWLQARLVQA